MKTFNFHYIWLLTLIGLMANTNLLTAQKAAKKEKPAKAQTSKKRNSAAAIAVQLSSMTREEKNTMAHCPLHNKHMSLSDNYRADASDFRQSDDYPFAYQLNYRRYCHVCTKVLDKEVKAFDAEEKAANNADGATFERCPVHNAALLKNSDYSKIDYEKSPQTEIPHAKQYLFKNYCKTCTKIYKIQLK
ncbi:hypothetical protein [Aureispira anguillae]|uniref:Uncharacterized protein n=1 Tax=Aureispira anguillae TaxID=2864201 RepID=A0A915YLA1_9BACT|nr:hypothetical protein [Aureispira anguillae]BDS15298.1 hypothetical protein AsAng_0060820 [Aureispira anguillae]